MDGAESFLVLHGLGNHRPPEHWQFWVSARLAAAGHQVLYPDLPEPDAPSLAAWSATVHGRLEAMQGPRRTVICHSLSCLLWFAIAADVDPARRPGRLLLVAPPDPHHVPPEGSDFTHEPSLGAVTASATEEVRIVCSDADPYNPTGAGRMFGEPLGCPVDLLAGAGHINPDSGYGPWPSVEAWCLRERATLTADR
jgi:predicted alpha/beta hydrolase family esterase